MSESYDIFCRDAVDVTRALHDIRSFSCGKYRPGDIETNEDDTISLPFEDIPDAMAPARDFGAVKMLLRGHNLDILREERKFYWKAVYLRLESASSTAVVSASKTTSVSDAQALVDAMTQLYNETVMTCFGTMDLPKEEPQIPYCIGHGTLDSYYLSEAGKISVARILTCFSYNAPDIRYCPMIYSIAAILRHYLSEEDTYGMLMNLAKCKRTKYIFDSELQYDVAWRVAYHLCYKYTKKSLSFLEAETSRDDVELLFNDWLSWIFSYLPLPHLVRIMDSYLLEGYKVLYRVCFALVHHFTKRTRAKNCSLYTSMKDNGLQTAFKEFCKKIPIPPNELFDRGFKFRGFSKSALQKTSIHVEVDLKAGKLKTLTTLSAKAVKRARSQSPDNLPTADEVSRIQATSATLTYKELITIWHWLPDRMTMSSPVLAYSSNEHGLSMQTFYSKSEVYEPTILVIKTTTQEIFGAYCSTSWAQRNVKDDRGMRQTYFGTGETFLFSFSVGQSQDGKVMPSVYQWVNTNSNGTSEDQSKADKHAQELFMCGQHDMIAIGGGGGNGIYIDSSLTSGHTESCSTFNNPPLCKNKDFQIAVIEVFGLFRIDGL